VTAPDWLAPLLDGLHGADPSEFLLRPREGVADLRKAAVLVLFGEGPQGPDLLLLQRTAHLRHHPGQPAFPGGGLDPSDDGPVDAALREAHEETGLDPAGVEVLATMPELWIPPTGNLVTPVLAWWRDPSDVSPADLGEVASVSRVPVVTLADPDNRINVKGPRGYVSPGFHVADMLVWGFTAAILDRLLRLGGWEQPWDRDRVEPWPVPA
jgi:8-oxo-dGTP pyrophosphatase MutT (NUDIX family)